MRKNMIINFFTALVLNWIIICLLHDSLYSQRRSREWHVAFMPNVKCAFPNVVSWLQKFESKDFKIKTLEVSEGILDPLTEIKDIDVLVALEGEYDPEKWEPLPTFREKIQIHFWPLTRGSITQFEEFKDLASERALILCDENDLLSRTCTIIFDALEGIYDLPSPQKLRHRDIKNWPPYDEFQDGNQLNTIILSLVNYNPNETLVKVIRSAPRKSIIIPTGSHVEFFEMLDSLRTEGSIWPHNRISNLFFPGVIMKDYLDLRQRQLFPVQTIVEIVLLINKQRNGNFLTEHDRRLLMGDLRAIYNVLDQDVNREMKAESQSWQNLTNFSNSVIDSICDRVWQITQKSRWALILSTDQQQHDKLKKLSAFVRSFVNTFSKETIHTFVYAKRVRFRELDYLIYPEDFWAINNLVDIYNKVGNYAGAKILAETIIDEDINLKVKIPYDEKNPTKNRDQQQDENFASFLDNYALALENLEVDSKFPKFVRKEARDLLSKWKSN